MDIKEENINTIYESMQKPEQDIGIVTSSLDGYIIANGLYSVFLGEKVLINESSYGIVFDILEDTVIIFNLDQSNIAIGSKVKRTFSLYSIDVSTNMLGHSFNIAGECIDSNNFSHNEPQTLPIEREVPNITERAPIDEPLETGFLLIDALIPIGKGQRQLFIGNQNTGKTYTAINSFIRNKNNKNIVCIYVTIGQQQNKTVKIKEYLEKNDALEKTIIVSANASEPAINNYLAPYVGCTVAEYFAHYHKKHVIIVYDDLSNQAIAFRQLCLLMRRAPSRDAYPGDVFYLHARLLERAGKFSTGGSITALPIAQLSENDLSAYIPTNLISITDGQTVFDTKLFNKGFKPAINTELSVSRVGGAAQYSNIKTVSKSLRLELAQYHELQLFSQFTSDLDEKTIEKLEKGTLLFSLLQQGLNKNYGSAEKYLILYTYQNFYKELSKIKNKDIFFSWIIDLFMHTLPSIFEHLSRGEIPNNDEITKLNQFISNNFIFYETM